MEILTIIEQVYLETVNLIFWSSLFSYVMYSIIRVVYLEEGEN